VCHGIARAALKTEDRFRVVRLRTNAKMIVDISDILAGIYFYGTDYEPETTGVILQLLRPGDIAFDIGAHLGYFTLLMASIVGDAGQIHSFEPNPALMKILVESLKINRYHNVIANQLAVSDRRQRGVEFFLSQIPQNSGLSSLCPHEYGLKHGFFSLNHKIFVDTTTLDEYFQDHGIERCDLIKIDVELAESKVIKGMTSVLQDIRPTFVICETEVGSEADSLLRQFGYVPYIITMSDLRRVEEGSVRYWGNLLYVSGDVRGASPSLRIQEVHLGDIK
jgi:FkbM family methyltransferase